MTLANIALTAIPWVHKTVITLQMFFQTPSKLSKPCLWTYTNRQLVFSQVWTPCCSCFSLSRPINIKLHTNHIHCPTTGDLWRDQWCRPGCRTFCLTIHALCCAFIVGIAPCFPVSFIVVLQPGVLLLMVSNGIGQGAILSALLFMPCSALSFHSHCTICWLPLFNVVLQCACCSCLYSTIAHSSQESYGLVLFPTACAWRNLGH